MGKPVFPTPARRIAVCTCCLALIIGTLLVPTLAGAEHPSLVRAQPRPAAVQQSTCRWEWVDTSQALATGGGQPGMEAVRTAGRIDTSYRHAGNAGCNEQTFKTIHTWTEPGASLTPGDELTFEVGFAWELDGTPECSALTAGGSTSLTAGATTIRVGQDRIIVSSEPGGSLSDSGAWTVPAGPAEGATLSIKAHASSGSLGGTVTYQYRYVCAADDALPTTTPEPTATQKPAETPSPTSTVGPCVDAGARFSSFRGEVEFWQEGAPEYEYHFARLGVVLCVGDHVRTAEESSAILQFADLSTFVMGPESEIVLNAMPRQRSNLELVGGRLWTNIKRILRGDSIEVRTERSVTGVEGTTFVLETDSERTTLKVLDGVVSFTALASGDTVQVKTGESVSADQAGLSAIALFDVAEESARWPELPETEVEPAGQDSSKLLGPALLAIICGGVVVLVVLAGIALLLLRKGLKAR